MRLLLCMRLYVCAYVVIVYVCVCIIFARVYVYVLERGLGGWPLSMVNSEAISWANMEFVGLGGPDVHGHERGMNGHERACWGMNGRAGA